MAIKTTIQNLITSLIRSNSALIDKTEHADVEDALLLNSYGTVFRETQATTNTITTKNVSKPTLQYDFFICKQGRKVSLKGSIINNSNSIVGGDLNWFFEITNYEYLQSTAINTVGGVPILCPSVNGGNVKVRIKSNRLIVSTIGANDIVNVDIEYLTEN